MSRLTRWARMTQWTMPRRTDDDVVSGGGMRLTEVDKEVDKVL